MKKLGLLVFASLVTCSFAFSQVEKGDINVSGSLSFTKFKDVDGFGIFEAKGGYFFTQNIEAGTTLNIMFGPTTITGIGPYASYNFLTQDAKLLPYAGANLSFLFGDGFSSTALGANGGAKYFLTETVNVDAGLSLQQGFGDLKGSVFIMRIGIGFILGDIK